MSSFIPILTNRWDVPRNVWELCLAFRIAANLFYNQETFSEITMPPSDIISQTGFHPDSLIHSRRGMMIGTSQKTVALTDGLNSILGIFGYHI